MTEYEKYLIKNYRRGMFSEQEIVDKLLLYPDTTVYLEFVNAETGVCFVNADGIADSYDVPDNWAYHGQAYDVFVGLYDEETGDNWRFFAEHVDPYEDVRYYNNSGFSGVTICAW